MKPDTPARQSPLDNGNGAPSGTRRGQLLIVEPDPLTQWSLKMYLERWFRVDGTSSVTRAEQVLAARAVDALIVSEELLPAALASLEQRAYDSNAQVAVVRTITDSSKPRRPGPHQGYLEKPFELAQLARLLGIPEAEIPND